MAVKNMIPVGDQELEVVCVWISPFGQESDVRHANQVKLVMAGDDNECDDPKCGGGLRESVVFPKNDVIKSSQQL